MSTKQLLLSEIDKTPDVLLREVLDFVLFLRAKKARPQRDEAIASESCLNKDWLSPEEDEAWQDL